MRKRERKIVSWQEIDKLLQKLFDSDNEKQLEEQNKKENHILKPTEDFKSWLDNHILEEEFTERRMICCYCGKKIENDRYIVINHPELPETHLKQIYFHTNKRCNPRYRFVNQRREMWLREYNYRVTRKKNESNSRKRIHQLLVALTERIDH